MSDIISGRKCYDHLGGKLGSRLFDMMIEKEWIKLEDGKSTVFEITEQGAKGLLAIGVDINKK